jgi:hypothetical protein
MKIRTGFVSNSSSSSFVVIMKNGKELDKETLLETFDVSIASPLYGFAFDLTEWILNNVKKQNIKDIYRDYIGSGKLTDAQMIESIVENYSKIYQDDKRIELQKIANDEIFYYAGKASSDSNDPIESYLYNRGVDIETDDIEIKCND